MSGAPAPAAPARTGTPAGRGTAPRRHSAPAAGYDGPAWAPPRPAAPGPQRHAHTRAADRQSLTRARRIWSLLPAAGLTGTAGYGFHRVFEPAGLLPVLLVAVLVPVLVSLGLSGLLPRRGRTAPLWPSVLLTVVLWLAVVCATLFREHGGPLPTGDAVRTVWTALLDSPHAVLTTILPVPGGPELLVLPHAVVWLASFTAAELALRTRAPLLPALPAVAAFGFPVVLGAAGPGSNTLPAAVFVASAAVLVLVRSPASAPGGRGLAVAVPFAAALAVAAGLLGPHAPGLSSRDPYDLRRQVDPPVERPQSASPLDWMSAWTQHPDTALFTVRATGPGAPDGDDSVTWRLTVLDRFNGTKWTSGAELARSGGRVPSEPGADPGGRKRLEQRVTVHDLPGIWLPAADRPTRVDTPDGTEVSVDPAAGVVATGADGSTGGKANEGLEYTAVSQLPVYDVKRLQYAAATGDQAAKEIPLTDDSGQPVAAVKTFREAAVRATRGSSYPYQQAVRLADWLRRNHRFDPNAVPGHTYRNLEYFLTSGRRGTSEQFAASFAVMARTLGLPARVAVGFRTGAGTEGGARRVTGADALAWPEVEFEGIGWVPFYPTPGRTTEEGSSVAPAGQPKERKKVDEEVAEQPRTSDPAKPGEKNEETAGGGAGGGPPAWVYPPSALVLLAAAYCLFALWVPYRRRRRRRGAADSGQRVLGAWEQIVERLTEIGLPPTSAHTATEVASFGARRVGGAAGEHLPALAKLVNEVGYAGRTPGPASAEAAWLHCDAVEKAVVRSVNRRARLRRTLHPRSLGRR